MSIYLSISKHSESLADRCAEVLESLGQQALERDGRFVAVLSSSDTLKEVYARWAARSTLDWSKVIVVADMAPPAALDGEGNGQDSLESALFSALPNPPQVIRPEGGLDNPEETARVYEAQIREVLGQRARAHVSLLELAVDGHTASLYPGSDAVRESDRLCLPNLSPQGESEFALTVPFLRRTHKLMFVAAGAERADAVRRVLEGRLVPEDLPAQFFLRDDRLNVNLLLDEAAAAGLSRRV